ncbi:hypothetical protein U1Q18_009062 [Sarracenia purpurea var. burkii]
MGTTGKTASQKEIKSIIFKNDLMEGITGEIELNKDEEDRSKRESIKERESGMALHGDNFGSEEYEDWMGRVLQRDRPNDKIKGGEPTAELGLEGPLDVNPTTAHTRIDPNDPNATYQVYHTHRENEVSQAFRVQRWKRRAREANVSPSTGTVHGDEK